MKKRKNIFARLLPNKYARRIAYFVDEETGVEYIGQYGWCSVRVNQDGTPRINEEWKEQHKYDING